MKKSELEIENLKLKTENNLLREMLMMKITEPSYPDQYTPIRNPVTPNGAFPWGLNHASVAD